MSRKRAFTLFELMVGLAIFLAVISGSLLTILNCTLLNDSSRNLAKAATDAQYVLEQIKSSLSYSDISVYTAPTFTNLPSEAVSLTRSMGSTLGTVSVTVNWQERKNARSFTLTTFFAK